MIGKLLFKLTFGEKALEKILDELLENTAKIKKHMEEIGPRRKSRLQQFYDDGCKWILTDEEKIARQKKEKELDAIELTDEDFIKMVEERRQYYPDSTDEELLQDFKKAYKKIYKKYNENKPK